MDPCGQPKIASTLRGYITSESKEMPIYWASCPVANTEYFGVSLGRSLAYR